MRISIYAQRLSEICFVCFMIRMTVTAGWCRKPSLPLLYIAGREDPCIRSVHAWKKAIALMRNVGYTNIVQKLYPAARHELHNEACREQVLTDLLQWIDSITMRICA